MPRQIICVRSKLIKRGFHRLKRGLEFLKFLRIAIEPIGEVLAPLVGRVPQLTEYRFHR